MKKTIAIILTTLLLLSSVVYAQKTVRVREYRRKDGTVVRTHTRRAPHSTSTSPAPPVIEYDPVKAAEPRELSPSEALDAIASEPYDVVDLGKGSTYTPGGTGTTRPRYATRTPLLVGFKDRKFEPSPLDELSRLVLGEPVPVPSQTKPKPKPKSIPERPPVGATAQCRDGSYSFSRSRRGTCSHHGGVRRWL